MSTNLSDTETEITLPDFERLFKTWYTPMCRSVNRMVQDKTIAEDIVQEVFYNFWNKRKEYKITVSLKSYLFKSAINAALAHLKNSKRWSNFDNVDENYPLIITSDNDGEIDAKKLEIKIQSTIDSMPTGCRTMFVMSRYEEMSYKEIAAATETSVKTVENQISKALKIMRIALSDYFILLIIISQENILNYLLQDIGVNIF